MCKTIVTDVDSTEDYYKCPCGFWDYLCSGDHKCEDCEKRNLPLKKCPKCGKKFTRTGSIYE